jgi:hypothetical protein
MPEVEKMKVDKKHPRQYHLERKKQKPYTYPNQHDQKKIYYGGKTTEKT